ncbi:MAG TPA: hypothetical protein VLA89_17240, partial [Gemmatimonadales bacterium]|nr:hypothetical protein [Gemmatimonadales bacterium]
KRSTRFAPKTMRGLGSVAKLGIMAVASADGRAGKAYTPEPRPTEERSRPGAAPALSGEAATPIPAHI